MSYLHLQQNLFLQRTIFPLGYLDKTQVRQLARHYDLPVAERADSQDLCFAGANGYQGFLIRNAPDILEPGPILTLDGRQIGQHNGLALFTNGQRKGLGISAPHPLYVIEKDTRRNALIVGPKEALGRVELITNKVFWISGKAPPKSFDADIKIRYKSGNLPGRVFPKKDGRVRVRFYSQVRDITPGQAAVFYNSQICLGGGIIQR